VVVLKVFVDEIRKAGLNDYEARSYLSLLKLGPAKVSELASAAAIPRARIYDVLANLQAKGFVIKNSARPLAYTALQPDEAFMNFAEHKKNSFSKHMDELNTIKEFIEGQFEYGKPSLPDRTDSFVVHGRSNIYSKILAEGAGQGKAVFCSTGEGIKRKKADLTSKLKEKGITASFISDEKAPRSVLFGRDGLFLFLTDSATEASQEKGIFIRSPSLARSFHSLIKKR
jgi:sugar-specific transcriptional regulator TrmB